MGRAARLGLLLLPADPGFAQEPESERISLAALAQVDYRKATDAPETAPSHEFNLRRARLTIEGRVTQKIHCELQLQGDTGNLGSASLIDAYVDFLVRPWLTVRAGQNKYEFDFEARESDAAIPFLDRSFASNAVAGSLNGASTPNIAAAAARDRGVTLLTRFRRSRLEWGLGGGLYQGSGRTSDNNSDWGFTLHAQAERGAAKLGTGYLRSPSHDQGAPERSVFSGWTAGAVYDRGRVLLRGEYYGGRRALGGSTQDLSGFYLVGGVSLRADFDVLLRYQRLRDGQFPAPDDRIHSVDVGVKWFYDRRGRCAGTSLAANVMFRGADPGFDRGVTLLDDGRGTLLTSGRQVGTVVIVRWQVEF